MLHKLYYAWRVLTTGISFALFSIGGLLATVFVFPIQRLITRDTLQREHQAQRIIHRMFRFYIKILEAMYVIKVRVKNADKLTSCKGCLIVANHPSLLDVVALMSVLPKAQCLVKSALWDNFFLGGVMRSAGYIRNDVNSDLLIEDCARHLKAGDNIVLFPEGTRSKPGRPIKFKRGAAHLALAAGADIQFASIVVTPSTLTKGVPWYKVAKSRIIIDIVIGERLDIAPYLLHETRSIAARNLTKRLEQPYAEF